MEDSPSVSVVIPTLNEARTLPRLLDQLRAQEKIALDIVVADGGSRDDSRELAKPYQVRVVESRPGRARQLNAGAALAKHDTLLFLHADSEIRDARLLSEAVKSWLDRRFDSDDLAGHFQISFTRARPGNAAAYRYLEAKSASNRPQTINGDQGLLIHRDFFDRLGGFDENLPFMEDQQMAQRIFDRGQWMLLPGTLHTSARRFESEGFHRRYVLMGMMMAFYWTGGHEFFKRAEKVYPQQRETEKLRLWPYFKAIWLVLLKDMGAKRALGQYYRLGRYARENLWQVFFFMDVHLLPGSPHRLVRWYDRRLAPVTANRLFDLLASPFVLVWYLFILGPWYFISEQLVKPFHRARVRERKSV